MSSSESITSNASLDSQVLNNSSMASITLDPWCSAVNPASPLIAHSLALRPNSFLFSFPKLYTSLILSAASSGLHLSSQI